MEFGDKLKELNLTADELNKFTKAFKDDKFREMLRDYAQEISDPENKKKYEEEIKLLEQERGNSIEFIHPTPFRVIRTSEGGKRRCFINICTNEKVGKPEFKSVVSEGGRRGQCWSLPHTLHPGREDTDAAGNKFMIYDVVYHPDTLYIASRNKKFMDMVDDTSIQGIQKAFNVILDKKNVKEMRAKYKGTPQTCVIRKPTPGYKAKEPPEQPDPLAFPFPDELQTNPVELPPTENSNRVEPKNHEIQLPETKEPTKPNYNVKYRSFIDLQDFRCSRDSAQSPRPKEIVVTIDMPLLKSVTNTNLEVTEKSLLLESKNPDYRLQLPLAYPVDDDKGEAKFNKQKRQLTVTLPVRPPDVTFDYCVVPSTSVSNGESLEERRGDEKDIKWDEREQEQQTSDTKTEGEERRMEEHKTRADKWEEGEKDREERKRKLLEQKGPESDEKLQEMKANKEEGEQLALGSKQNQDTEIVNHNNPEEDSCDKSAEKDSYVLEKEIFAGEKAVVHNRPETSPKTKHQHILICGQHSSHTGEDREARSTSSLESAPKMKSKDSQETRRITMLQENMQVRTDAAPQNHTCSEESLTAADTAAINQCNEGDVCLSEGGAKSSKTSAADVAKTSNSGEPGRCFTLCSANPTPASEEENKEDADEDDLPAEQIFQTSQHDEPSPSLLREIHADGNETVISDHSTSAGFIFQNKLMYELD